MIEHGKPKIVFKYLLLWLLCSFVSGSSASITKEVEPMDDSIERVGTILTPGMSGAKAHNPPSEEAKSDAMLKYLRFPVHFIENRGQMDDLVRYYAHMHDYRVFFTSSGIHFALPASTKKEDSVSGRAMEGNGVSLPDSSYFGILPMGMSAETQIEARELQGTGYNSFIGGTPQKWISNIPTYKEIVYRNVYPGIDLKFYGTNRQIEYDIIRQLKNSSP